MNSLRWIRKDFDYISKIQRKYHECSVFTLQTRRGAFNFHNCSDINIHKNSTKTFKITYATYNCFFIVHYVIGFFLTFSFGDDCIS